MNHPEWIVTLRDRYRRIHEPVEQLCRPAFDERAAASALYKPSGRLTVVPQNSAREVEASGRPTQGSDSVSTLNVEPELVGRRRLIAALDQATLRALSTHGDLDDRNMACSELRLREANLFSVPVTTAEDDAWDDALGQGRM